MAPGKIVTGTPGDLSKDEASLAVAFFASAQATFISGITLLVDGGWMAY